MSADQSSEGDQKAAWFPATRWTDIVAAGRDSSPAAAEALNRLCSTYWYPIYAYIRRKGHSDADAKDIAQGFFSHILERNLVGTADRTKGKFRSFLLGSLNYFMANLRDFDQAKKRGGGSVIVSLDEKTAEERYALEPIDELSPEKLFERRWALDLHDQAVFRLREEYARQGKGPLFDQLQPFLTDQTDSGDYAGVARTLQMTLGAVTTAANRVRGRYGELITAEVARTVASPEEVPSERRYIFELLCRANAAGSRPQ
ncbi:MAG: sigma-70 family RNA polymerase sigma factor [Verrucomicrobiales bacterium]|jgi:DNA-directed RNA polymerase specialized sigma24 family protein|nr:sigma-70 family RNA polymerase sigma factor [Verrucomicrobiales bacterium]